MWLAGHIMDKVSLLSFLIKLEDDQVVYHHQNQVRSHPCIPKQAPQSQMEDNLEYKEAELNMPSNAALQEVIYENPPDFEQPATALTSSALLQWTGCTIKLMNQFSPD